MRHMTKQEAINIFKSDYMPTIRQHELNGKDIVMRELEWSYFIDMLCKDGSITLKQYDSWVTPGL